MITSVKIKRGQTGSPVSLCKERLNSDDKKNSTNIKKTRTIISHLHSHNTQKTTTYGIGNPDPGPRQAQ